MERLVFRGGPALGTPLSSPSLGSQLDVGFCWYPKIWCHLPQASFCTYCTILFQNKWKTAFVQHMFSSYSKLFLKLEGLRHYYPFKPYTKRVYHKKEPLLMSVRFTFAPSLKILISSSSIKLQLMHFHLIIEFLLLPDLRSTILSK